MTQCFLSLGLNRHNGVNVENRQPLMEIEFEPEFMGVMGALTGVKSTSVPKNTSGREVTSVYMDVGEAPFPGSDGPIEISDTEGESNIFCGEVCVKKGRLYMFITNGLCFFYLDGGQDMEKQSVLDEDTMPIGSLASDSGQNMHAVSHEHTMTEEAGVSIVSSKVPFVGSDGNIFCGEVCVEKMYMYITRRLFLFCLDGQDTMPIGRE